MSILTDITICEELEKGNIIISPFNHKHLGNCSYDVSLGDNFYRTNGKNIVYDPFDEYSVSSSWELNKAELSYDISERLSLSLNICADVKIILLYPRETILAHTNEFIGAVSGYTTMMKARSSVGRNFIEVCKCAGWGDIGYVNRWTMEITNNSDYYIPLIVGMKIAQIVFISTGPTNKPYRGKYQSEDPSKIDQIVANWSPEQMLPKIYLDPDNSPQ